MGNADWAIETIDKLRNAGTGQPWLLMVGLVRPHTPLYAPDEYYDMFPLDQIQIPEGLEKEIGIDNGYASSSDTSKILGFKLQRHLTEDFTDLEGFKKWFQAYYACMAFVDVQIGKVVDHLETTEFWSNTIVAFFPDNGWDDATHQYLFKNSPWDAGARVPLTIRAPGVQQTGLVVSDEPVTLADVYPTLLDLCGYAGEQTMKDTSRGAPLSGSSLTSLISGSVIDTGRVAISQISPTWNKLSLPWPDCNTDSTCNHWSVRSKDYRYIIYNHGAEELYDHTKDPKEGNNVAMDSEYAETKALMRSHLLQAPGMEDDKDMLGKWTKNYPPKPDCCKGYCAKNKNNWTIKCAWGSNDCSQCDGCEEPIEGCPPAPTPSPPVPGVTRSAAVKRASAADVSFYEQMLASDEDYYDAWEMGAMQVAQIRSNKAWFRSHGLMLPKPIPTNGKAPIRGKLPGGTFLIPTAKPAAPALRPKPAAPSYYKVKQGFEVKCPDGEELADAADCDAAVKALGLERGPDDVGGNAGTRPCGCYLHDNGKVKFNSEKSICGGSKNKRFPICKRS